MLKLYGKLRSRVTRNVWLVEELGIPYERVDVIQANRLPDPSAPGAPLHTRHPDFLKVNPAGHIPAMDDDGLVIGESLAINLHLARKHGGPLGPRDAAEDAQMTMWTLWAATDVEPHASQILYNRVMRPPEQRDEALAKASVIALDWPFGVLDAHLAKAGGHLVGGRFTVADINVSEVARYAQAAPDLFDKAPHVKAWLAACHARPAFREMMRQREAEPV
ncbi:MAG: glutathione S-transferase family protein [Methylobacteriaceae bacterium]|nr:glutathione S-transferase family protein [Methylobacteriaceae bacterium]